MSVDRPSPAVDAFAERHLGPPRRWEFRGWSLERSRVWAVEAEGGARAVVKAPVSICNTNNFPRLEKFALNVTGAPAISSDAAISSAGFTCWPVVSSHGLTIFRKKLASRNGGEMVGNETTSIFGIR